MRLTERQLGGWSLLLGTAIVAVGFALSPGRGAVDNVSFVTLDDDQFRRFAEDDPGRENVANLLRLSASTREFQLA